MKISSWVTGLATVVTMALSLIACSSNSPIQPESVTVTLDKNEVADLFGNNDGVTTSEELAKLEDYFSICPEAWCVTYLGNESWTADAVTPAEVKKDIESMATQPYSDGQLLRRAYIGKRLKTPYVAIAVLSYGDRISVTNFFRVPGPNVSGGEWVRLDVKEVSP